MTVLGCGRPFVPFVRGCTNGSSPPVPPSPPSPPTNVTPPCTQFDIGVFIVDNLKQARFVPVTIERSETDGIWVSGLPETADVITVGQGYVSDGQPVETARMTTETAVAAGPGT